MDELFDLPIKRVKDTAKFGMPLYSDSADEDRLAAAKRNAPRASYREIPDDGAPATKKGRGRKRSLSASSSSSEEGGFPESVRTIHKDVAAIRERFPGKPPDFAVRAFLFTGRCFGGGAPPPVSCPPFSAVAWCALTVVPRGCGVQASPST